LPIKIVDNSTPLEVGFVNPRRRVKYEECVQGIAERKMNDRRGTMQVDEPDERIPSQH
jgi:hypothetical protein